MEALIDMKEIEDRLLKRFTILKKLEYYINESIYYRSYKDDINPSNKQVLWKVDEDFGKIKAYEDTH